ncbi:hypothetical protein CL617_01765 [archaeon]|nr:hypothetical protein [archaeon]|tara:strand:+ start:2690 stop:3019 length:330 start_codon:yes stop_codon:yes gene_type:complete
MTQEEYKENLNSLLEQIYSEIRSVEGPKGSLLKENTLLKKSSEILSRIMNEQLKIMATYIPEGYDEGRTYFVDVFKDGLETHVYDCVLGYSNNQNGTEVVKSLQNGTVY